MAIRDLAARIEFDDGWLVRALPGPLRYNRMQQVAVCEIPFVVLPGVLWNRHVAVLACDSFAISAASELIGHTRADRTYALLRRKTQHAQSPASGRERC